MCVHVSVRVFLVCLLTSPLLSGRPVRDRRVALRLVDVRSHGPWIRHGDRHRGGQGAGRHGQERCVCGRWVGVRAVAVEGFLLGLVRATDVCVYVCVC